MDALVKHNEQLPAKFGHYEPVMKEIDDRLQSFLIKTYGSALSGGAGFAEIVGLIELGHGMITDARDFREKKIQSLAAQLKELKFKSRQELVKPKDEGGSTAVRN